MTGFRSFILLCALAAGAIVLILATPAHAQKTEAECRKAHLGGYSTAGASRKESMQRAYQSCVAGLKRR